MNAKLVQRPIAAAVAAALLVSACVTNPDGSIKMDDRAKGALIGAVAGCALASASGSDCAKGAVVGAAVGFLVGWYFESKKVADAKQVNAEYQKQKVAIPKKEITPVAFSSKVTQAKPDAKGDQEVQITSSTDLIGYGDKVPEVQQKYAIYDENNKLVEEKIEKLTAVDGAGRYQTNSKFTKPANAKGKNYTVKTALIANNKTYKENSYKVSFQDGGAVMLASVR
ncbi:glycine zipper family protein [Denitratisoma sp. DHT3]|uniref:glycine zipper family protein n=1 Tax=Denitratisoma sp. DHT3 TaxID=1981880 RepID=UPI001646DD27|nr:glycine zipper family protein [Denitratisoma sp. DHT3]